MTTLSASEQQQLSQLRGGDAFVDDVLHHVEHILGSQRFKRVQNHAKEFLRYVVSKTLLGLSEHIKESTIAIAVFEEAPGSFDPLLSSKVRVAGLDLRRRLADYAAHEGRQDHICIRLPRNTYVPAIEDRRIAIAVAPFENWHPRGEHAHLSDAVTAELLFRFGAAGVRAGSPSYFQATTTQYEYILRGSIEHTGAEHVRIYSFLTDQIRARAVCSPVFDGRRDDLLRMARAVANAAIAGLKRKLL